MRSDAVAAAAAGVHTLFMPQEPLGNRLTNVILFEELPVVKHVTVRGRSNGLWPVGDGTFSQKGLPAESVRRSNTEGKPAG